MSAIKAESSGQDKFDPETAKAEIDRLSRELIAAQQERSQSASYGLELLNEKENLQQQYENLQATHEQAKIELQELREAWNKAVSEQRVSATTVFEKEVQLLNDSDALAASFTIAKQEIEKELKQTKSLLETVTNERDRLQGERDDLAKRVQTVEHDRKNLRAELKDLRGRETKLFNENSDLEEENVSLQKQVSNLRSTQVEFESSKHEIQRLQDELVALNSQLEEALTLRRMSERHMEEALEALRSEREQKYTLRKELDKRNSADPSLINWTSLAALKGSPHLANLALRGFNSSHRASMSRETENVSPNGFSDPDTIATFGDNEQGFDIIHDLEMPSIEGSLFDEVHLTEIKKLQQNLEEKENQRSNLNTKLIEIQHKLDSKSRQADEIEKKLTTMCDLIEDFYSNTDIYKLIATPTKCDQQVSGDVISKEKVSEVVTSTTHESNQTNPSAKLKALDDFEVVYSHLKNLFSSIKSYQELVASIKNNSQVKSDSNLASDLASLDLTGVDGDKKTEVSETVLQTDDIQSLTSLLYKKNEQLKQLRTVLKTNKESSEVALMNLKTKYDMEKAIVNETMTNLRRELKRLSEDAATFASLRSHFSSRIEEYNTEIEKLQSKLAASEQEKNTLNSLLRMSIEQKVMLVQKLEVLEMAREDSQSGGSARLGNQSRDGVQQRGRGSSRGSRNTRQPARQPTNGNERR